MKKIIVAFAVVAMAAIANAATVTWGSGTIALPSGTQAGKGDVTAYLFNVTESIYNTYATYTDAAKLSTDIYAAYKDSLASADATRSSTARGVAKLNDGVDYGVGTYYAVVLYIATEGTTDYFMGNYATKAIESTMNVEASDLALKLGGTGAATSWQTAAAPEPTSGLLLFLGMASLALKRKCA